jgi:hypothetical protein
MLFNQEKRKQLNEHIVESKKNLGNMIGFMRFTPLSASIS